MRVRLPSRFAALLSGVVVLTTAAAASAADGPVRVETIVRASPQQRLFVARVDLTDPRVSVQVASGGPDPDGPGPWDTVLTPPSVIAKTADFEVAINTVFFAHQSVQNDLQKYFTGEPALAINAVVIDGKAATPNVSGTLLWFDRQNRGAIRVIDGPPGVNALPAGVWQAAAGSRQIVTDGTNTAGEDDDRHPRTAAGLTADGRTLVLLVADGRRPGWAAGLTLAELADEMIRLGCRAAVNFDGGGSSTMVRKIGPRWRVLNTPSDGATFLLPLSVERPVPYVLGVRVKGN